MLITAKLLKGYALRSLDGMIGKARQFYFDDQYWTIRYLVADTGRWLPHRQVLISPHALGAVSRAGRRLDVRLTKKQIEESPALSSDKPVSRQFEDSFYGYYGWPAYWRGPYMWGPYSGLMRDGDPVANFPRPRNRGNPHLRSTREVRGYRVHAEDGEIGHVSDFIIDDRTWTIRYFIINTRNWRPGEKVLVSTRWVERVSWGEQRVFVDLSREMIERSPKYKAGSSPSREYETELHDHYGRRGYWDEIPAEEYENRPLVR